VATATSATAPDRAARGGRAVPGSAPSTILEPTERAGCWEAGNPGAGGRAQ